MHSDPLSGLSKPHKKNTVSANIDTVSGSVHAKGTSALRIVVVSVV